MQEADAEEEEEGAGRRRARDVRRDARQAERELQANRMRKKDVRPLPATLTLPPLPIHTGHCHSGHSAHSQACKK